MLAEHVHAVRRGTILSKMCHSEIKKTEIVGILNRRAEFQFRLSWLYSHANIFSKGMNLHLFPLNYGLISKDFMTKSLLYTYNLDIYFYGFI